MQLRTNPSRLHQEFVAELSAAGVSDDHAQLVVMGMNVTMPNPIEIKVLAKAGTISFLVDGDDYDRSVIDIESCGACAGDIAALDDGIAEALEFLRDARLVSSLVANNEGVN